MHVKDRHIHNNMEDGLLFHHSDITLGILKFSHKSFSYLSFYSNYEYVTFLTSFKLITTDEVLISYLYFNMMNKMFLDYHQVQVHNKIQQILSILQISHPHTFMDHNNKINQLEEWFLETQQHQYNTNTTSNNNNIRSSNNIINWN